MKTNAELINEMKQEIVDMINADNGEGWETVSKVTENKTRKNLFAELEKIAEAVKKNGCAIYIDNSEKINVTGLVVCHQGCIGAIIDAPIYTINEIYVNSVGEACISGWAVDSIGAAETIKDLFDPDNRYFPAFMIYDIETGKYFIKNTSSMLETYQRTLDGEDDIAPVACSNARRRVGGKYYGMSWEEYFQAALA